MNQTILFKRLHPAATMPRRASEHAAGFDLFSCETRVAGDKVIVSTGLAVAFPEDHVLLIYGRSGLAFKHGIRLINGVGVIDADYRGEILLAFQANHLNGNFLLHDAAFRHLSVGNRVAQAILMPIPQVTWEEMAPGYDLPPTIRGNGGFGSTGAT